MASYKHGEYVVVFKKSNNQDDDDFNDIISNSNSNGVDDIPDGRITEPPPPIDGPINITDSPFPPQGPEGEGEGEGEGEPVNTREPGREPGREPVNTREPIEIDNEAKKRDSQAGGWGKFTGRGKAQTTFSDKYTIGEYSYDKIEKIVKGEGGVNKTKDMGTTGLNKVYTDSFKNLLKDLPIFNVLANAKDKNAITNQITDWKDELKSFIDTALKQGDKTQWGFDRRHIGSRNFIDRSHKVNPKKDSFKTVVLAIDTSASISKYQIEAFINEMATITADKFRKYSIGELIIIYCDDAIKDVDRIKVNGRDINVNWDKLRRMTQGGNSDGFHPPFKWLEENGIVPSVMVYFTDLEANVPSPTLYNIEKYKHKVVWWLMKNSEVLQSYEEPPFGKYIFCPLSVLKGTDKRNSKI